MNWNYWIIICVAFIAACGDVEPTQDAVDPIDECVTCDDRADAFGISRTSYLAYGIVEVANSATFDELDIAVGLDARAARGIVAKRPFEFIEEIDAVPYVGRVAFTSLAAYAQAGGLPYCGDGSLQSAIEACDDGNAVDGDGCSASCSAESRVAVDLSAEPDLIRGSDIGVPQVKARSFYFRKRSLKAKFWEPEWSFQASEEMLAFLRRVETLRAGTVADGVVTWDDLALMSKSPFYQSLLPDERALLQQAWEMFELNTAPVVDVSNPTPIPSGFPHAVKITRTGRYRVAVRQVDGSALLQRLQQLPSLNADNDPETVEFRDVQFALEHYDNVFTDSEIWSLTRVRDEMFDAAEPSSGGRLYLDLDELPASDFQVHRLAEFDGWRFDFSRSNPLEYSVSTNPFYVEIANQPFNRLDLSRNGQFDNECEGVDARSSCSNTFRYRGVRYYGLDGVATTPRFERGLVVMEYWENGVRTYNRVLKLGSANLQPYSNSRILPEYFVATPRYRGVALGFTLDKPNTYSLDQAGAVGGTIETLLPGYLTTLRTWLRPGRYAEVSGVVIDAHKSGAAVAYFDGCTKIGRLYANSIGFEKCQTSGRKVTISEGGMVISGDGTTRAPLVRDMNHL